MNVKRIVLLLTVMACIQGSLSAMIIYKSKQEQPSVPYAQMSPEQKAQYEKDMALLRGIRDGNVEQVRAALESGANVYSGARDTGKAFHFAFQAAFPLFGREEPAAPERLAILNLLLEHKADAATLSPLLFSYASVGKLEAIKWLTAHGLRDTDGAALKEILRVFQNKDEPEMMKQYLEILGLIIPGVLNPAELQEYLIPSARGGNVELVQWLLRHGVRDSSGEALKEAKRMLKVVQEYAEKETDEHGKKFWSEKESRYQHIIDLLTGKAV